jgi:hypothetical protein
MMGFASVFLCALIFEDHVSANRSCQNISKLKLTENKTEKQSFYRLPDEFQDMLDILGMMPLFAFPSCIENSETGEKENYLVFTYYNRVTIDFFDDGWKSTISPSAYLVYEIETKKLITFRLFYNGQWYEKESMPSYNSKKIEKKAWGKIKYQI